MSKTDEKVEKYLKDLKDKIGGSIDEDLLKKTTRACGPSIFNTDGETVSGTDKSELETVKKSFVMGKLGITDEVKADQGIEAVMEQYGKSNRSKYRAVVYYLLAKHFGKESALA